MSTIETLISLIEETRESWGNAHRLILKFSSPINPKEGVPALEISITSLNKIVISALELVTDIQRPKSKNPKELLQFVDEGK